MSTIVGRLYAPFRPLPADMRAAVAVIFLWMVLLSGGVTAALVKQGDEAGRRFKEQQTTAAQTYAQCERSRVFGPPFILHIERVEARLHTHALEEPVEYPPGSKRKVSVLSYFRSTIPKVCAKR